MSSSSDSDNDPQECPLCYEDAPVELPAYETWLQCDKCDEWYHGVCVGISPTECECIDTFHCKKCVEVNGPSLYKTSDTELRRSNRKHAAIDYSKLNEGQPATFNQYLIRLENHEFDEDEFEHLEDGTEVTVEWMRMRETNDPFIVKAPKGLGIAMPKSETTVDDIALAIGNDTPVNVMDVLTQEELSDWTLGQWSKYFRDKDRKRVLNVISLEISETGFGTTIKRPSIVDKLDLVEKYWPESKRKHNNFPRVKTYCLMSVKNAYTDFHMDFSATWVYYHVLSGRKVFYLVPPTPSNIRKFESWSKSPEQSVNLFADSVRQCYEVHVEAGNTLFIPAGWIHAVYTPEDSIVIGGNFLVMNSLNAHIGAYKLETRTKVPVRYRFPYFLKLCRYMAELLAKKWIKITEPVRARWTMSELEGVFVLAVFLLDKINDDNDPEDNKLLGNKDSLTSHLHTLIDLVGKELGSRMLSEEWVNREPQLREGCHFRWIRPGMPTIGSLLLARRPRRTRGQGTSGGANEQSISKIREKAAIIRPIGTRQRLTRGRPRSSNGNGSVNEDQEMISRNSIKAALGSGTTKNNDGDQSMENSDDENSDSVSSSSGDDGSSGSSSEEEDFVVSDEDNDGGGYRESSAKRRKTTSDPVDSPSLKGRNNGRYKTATQRIAHQLGIKF